MLFHLATIFCHDLGDVLFFRKEKLVFLRVDFLMDAFKLIVRHDHREATNWSPGLGAEHDIDQVKFEQAKSRLLRKGEMEVWFLDILWSTLASNAMDKTQKGNIVSVAVFVICSYDHNLTISDSKIAGQDDISAGKI